MTFYAVGSSIIRKDATDKVTGAAKYNSDFSGPGLLHARLFTSTVAHAWIKSIDISKAQKCPGVRAVITGGDAQILTGPLLEDRPPLARDKVRYYGEPLAVLVADSEAEAEAALPYIKVEYEPLPVVQSPTQALEPQTLLIHENPDTYKHQKNIYPQPHTNIAHQIHTRKGDMAQGWAESEVVVEVNCKLPQSDHIAMETRNVQVEILPDGGVNIWSSTQAPFAIRKEISKFFNIDLGKVVVEAPLVGGGYGGKAPVDLEFLGYLASRAVNGQRVKLANTREEDMVSSPCHLGLEGRVKLGATRDGYLKAAEMTYLVDSGAYTSTGPKMTMAMAANGTGPYHVDNVWCDALCVYTNHPYVTSFRGFGHPEYTFCIERTMEKLAFVLQIDPWELRMKNAILPGHTSPTQVKLTSSNLGNLPECLERVKRLINWDEGQRIELGHGKIRAKGLGCFWKTSSSPTDAHSGAIITFNRDGTMNLNVGAVEIGPATKTTMAQILAEKMKMDTRQIHVEMKVNTRTSPHHWKTVASMSTFMVGNAVLDAAEDVIKQLKATGAIGLRCQPEDLEVAQGRVYLREDPETYLEFTKVVHGFKYTNGNTVGQEIIGRGSFVMPYLTPLDPNTGKGKPGPYWTVGAQAVEVEYDETDYTYRLVKAVTVLDAGKVINPKSAQGVVMGGMCMGLGLGSRESFLYSPEGEVLNTSLRTYKPLRYGENPQYLVEFVETPNLAAPYGARGMGEHGILAMSACLANALSSAAEVDLNELPIIPELIWGTKKGAGK